MVETRCWKPGGTGILPYHSASGLGILNAVLLQVSEAPTSCRGSPWACQIFPREAHPTTTGFLVTHRVLWVKHCVKAKLKNSFMGTARVRHWLTHCRPTCIAKCSHFIKSSPSLRPFIFRIFSPNGKIIISSSIL